MMMSVQATRTARYHLERFVKKRSTTFK